MQYTQGVFGGEISLVDHDDGECLSSEVVDVFKDDVEVWWCGEGEVDVFGKGSAAAMMRWLRGGLRRSLARGMLNMWSWCLYVPHFCLKFLVDTRM